MITSKYPYDPNFDILPQVNDENALFSGKIWQSLSKQVHSFISHVLNGAIWFRMRSTEQAIRHDWFTGDHQHWCDMRSLEKRVGDSDYSGTVYRYATSEDEDAKWESETQANNLPSWQQIGCS